MELRDYLNVLRARRSIIFASIIVIVLAAIVVTIVQPRTYVGEAKVLISETDSGAALFGSLLPDISSQPQRGLDTQVELMQMRPLAEETIRELGLETTPDSLIERVDISAAGQTNLVVIEVRDEDPERAAETANSLAQQYVDWSRETRRESLAAAAEEVETRLEEARNEILELGRQINDAGKSDELDAELQIATGSYTTLAEKLEQLKINEQLEVGSGLIVSPAVVTVDPVSPQPIRNVGLGLLVGAALGIALAFLNEYLDDSLKGTEDVERVYEAPVLGTIPFEQYEKGEKRRLTISVKPGGMVAESYRVLRNSLDFINFDQDTKTIMITSAAPAEGKSTVAANLAAGLAQAGKRVVLVSCDFRRPTTQEFFSVNSMIGLSDVLLGAHSMKAALQRPGDEQLLIMTSGKMPPNPSELLASSKMEELVQNLEEWADWVILDTPPLLAVADPASVARWADTVIVVTQAHASTRDAARRANAMLTKVGARVGGVVVWGLIEGHASESYGYYVGEYYYSSYYASAAAPARSGDASDADVQAGGEEWIPDVSPGRAVARFLGKVMIGFLGLVAVIAAALLVIYFLDQYMAWGLVDTIFLQF